MIIFADQIIPSIMKYGIIGTGAIGGYYGAKLAYSGKDVHFLLHRDYDIVREKGLKVLSCDGVFSITSILAVNASISVISA